MKLMQHIFRWYEQDSNREIPKNVLRVLADDSLSLGRAEFRLPFKTGAIIHTPFWKWLEAQEVPCPYCLGAIFEYLEEYRFDISRHSVSEEMYSVLRAIYQQHAWTLWGSHTRRKL